MVSDSGSTWSGTHHFRAPHLVRATTIAEVQQSVRAGGKVRALGTRHSFHDLADTAGTLITVTGIDPDPQVDSHQRTVTVGAGISYGTLATWLQSQGWALHNMGSLPHISIGGAIATGTHGSGARNGALSTAVRTLEYVGADGELHTVSRADPDFNALVVGLGATGITTRLTLDIQPTYDVRQDIYYGMTWDTLLTNLDQIMTAAYSVSVFTIWDTDQVEQVWRKSRLNVDGDPPDQWHDATRHLVSNAQLVGGDQAVLTEQGGAPGPWLERLPHFRLESTPSNGDEIQTEYFVDRAHAVPAITAVRALAARIDTLLLITELRTLAADDLWLSGAYGRDTLAIHFTWRNSPHEVAALLPEIEQALAPWGARPHWGKWHGFTAASLDAAHPRLADAREVFERHDPDGRFSNDHLERLGLRESA